MFILLSWLKMYQKFTKIVKWVCKYIKLKEPFQAVVEKKNYLIEKCTQKDLKSEIMPFKFKTSKCAKNMNTKLFMFQL